jgi:hypothetical protein
LGLFSFTHAEENLSRIHFGGNWTAYSNANAYDGSSRYSESVGDTVSFYFTGTQFSLLYTGLINGGTIPTKTPPPPLQSAVCL